jgi:nuclear pore complex protein Nup214
LFSNLQDFSFRLQSKSQFFDGSISALSGAKADIVAAASCHGIVFVGSSNPEIIVACLRDLEAPHAVEKNVAVRKHPLPSPVTQIATNCDDSLLAVVVKLNGAPHVQLYSVASFLTPVSLFCFAIMMRHSIYSLHHF